MLRIAGLVLPNGNDPIGNWIDGRTFLAWSILTLFVQVSVCLPATSANLSFQLC